MKDFVNKYKGIRRTLLVLFCLLASLAVLVGCWQVVHGGLSQADSWFLTSVLGATSVPVGFYYHTRGKEP